VEIEVLNGITGIPGDLDGYRGFGRISWDILGFAGI